MHQFTRQFAAAVVLGSALASSAFAQQPAAPGNPAAAPPAIGTPGAATTSTAPVVPEQRPTGVAATVNNQQIPEVAVWRALRQFPPAEHVAARKEIINHLVENLLIDQYLTALKIDVQTSEVDKTIDELKAELKKSNKDYAKELQNMMLTEAEFRTEVHAQMKWDKFLKQQGTDQTLKAFFDKSPTIFDGTLVRCRHILLASSADAAKQAELKQTLLQIKATITAEANKVLAGLPATTDALTKQTALGRKTDELFGEYAKQYSACPSKVNGGDLQFFPRVGIMAEPFAEAAFKLELFGMSDIVETDHGYHLILCTARNPGKLRSFEEAKEDVRSVYAMQLRQAVVAQMKGRAQIQITATPTKDAPEKK